MKLTEGHIHIAMYRALKGCQRQPDEIKQDTLHKENRGLAPLRKNQRNWINISLRLHYYIFLSYSRSKNMP
jgi:hypothetical protein